MPPMKNDYKANRANYKQLRGVVGQYQGSDVYVVPEKDFNLWESKDDNRMIYALVVPGRHDLLLVSGGMKIGDMTPNGYVDLWEKSEFYDDGPEKAFEEPAVKSVEEPMAADFPQMEVPSTSGINVDDFLAGENLVDRFLREFKNF